MSYIPERALFTYRYRSPTAMRAPEVPHPKDITEIYLPSRTYAGVDVECLVSSGGRIKFDRENSRAYVWFVDEANGDNARKVDMPRRVDIWVSHKNHDEDHFWRNLLIGIIVVVLAALLAWREQHKQWAFEEREGIKVLSMFSGFRDALVEVGVLNP